MVPILLLPIVPIISLILRGVLEILVPSKLIHHLFEVDWRVLNLCLFHLFSPFSLLFFEALLFGTRQLVFALLESALIRSQARVCGRQLGPKFVSQVIQLQGEVCKVELLLTSVQVGSSRPQINGRSQRFNSFAILLQVVTSEGSRPGSLDFVASRPLLSHIFLIVVDETFDGVLVLATPPFCFEFYHATLARLLILNEHLADVLHIHCAKNYVVHKRHRSANFVLLTRRFELNHGGSCGCGLEICPIEAHLCRGVHAELVVFRDGVRG